MSDSAGQGDAVAPATSSPLSASASGADSNFPSQAVSPIAACQKKTWVGIKLVDKRGKPVPGKAYRLELPDGRVLEGTLDQLGTAGASGIDPGTCKITFPDLERKAWTRQEG